jgi:WD40 repeat protein
VSAAAEAQRLLAEHAWPEDVAVRVRMGIHNGNLLETLRGHPGIVSDLKWSPDGTRLLTGGGNKEQGAKDTTARICDGATGKELVVFRGYTKSVWAGDWSPNGKRIATFGDDGAVRIWDAATGLDLLTLSVPVHHAGGFAWWSPDGQHLSVLL